MWLFFSLPGKTYTEREILFRGNLAAIFAATFFILFPPFVYLIFNVGTQIQGLPHLGKQSIIDLNS